MQQVKFKAGSMEEARHGNEQAYYLFAIDGDYATLKYSIGIVWQVLVVNLVALEAVTPDVVLPVKGGDALVDVRDLLSELIRTVFDNEANFMHNFSIDGAMFDSGLDCFYMAGDRCFVRYELDGFTHHTTIRTGDFLAWVEGLDK